MDDIDSMMANKKLKKEPGTSSIPKSTAPVTRGKSQSKKKKTADSSDLVLLTDADPFEAQKFIQQVGF